MNGPTTILSLLAIGGVGLALASWKADRAAVGDANAPASPSSIAYKSGKAEPLKYAGVVLLSGPGLKGGAMTVHCAGGGAVFGFYQGDAIGLNGYSAGLVRQAEVGLQNGTRRPIRSTDRNDLQLVGVIEQGADPRVYHAKMDEGLQIGRKACG